MDLSRMERVGDVDLKEFRSQLLAKSDFVLSPYDAFGGVLVPALRASHIADESSGTKSLAFLFLGQAPRIAQSADGRLRAEFNIDRVAYDLSVTDTRLYRDDLATPDPMAIQRLRARLFAEEAITVVGIGLGRAYPGPLEKPVHWLQVNNVYPLSAPFWDT